MMKAAALFSLLLLFGGAVYAEPLNRERAHLHYMLYCQGCHTPDGSGSETVPRFKGHIGVFLNSAEGRAFLVRVPGAANSVLADNDLAEVLNWMVLEFGEESLPANFTPYTPEEVNLLRKEPLLEVQHYRSRLLARLLQ